MLPEDPALLALLLGLVFFVALTSSSVGHGGASGYLAVLSFFGLAPAAMAPGALCLNLLVAGTSFLSYRRAGHFNPRLLWPFLLTSIPFAFLGGLAPVSARAYLIILAGALIFAAYRLLVVVPRPAAGGGVLPARAVALGDPARRRGYRVRLGRHRRGRRDFLEPAHHPAEVGGRQAHRRRFSGLHLAQLSRGALRAAGEESGGLDGACPAGRRGFCRRARRVLSRGASLSRAVAATRPGRRAAGGHDQAPALGVVEWRPSRGRFLWQSEPHWQFSSGCFSWSRWAESRGRGRSTSGPGCTTRLSSRNSTPSSARPCGRTTKPEKKTSQL